MLTDHLARTHDFDLSAAEQRELAETYRRFFEWGPQIRYTAAVDSRGQPVTDGGASNAPTLGELLNVTDAAGQSRSFLATEERYQTVRAAHLANLIVPVTGNFAGGNTLREIGDFLRGKRIMVSVFYGSNVQDYLTPGQRRDYCAGLAALPHDDQALFLSFPVRRGGTLRTYATNCPGSN